MQCWHVVDDIDMITKHFVDDPAWAGDHFSAEATDALMNKYFAIKELYEVKFDHLFKTFEKVCVFVLTTISTKSLNFYT